MEITLKALNRATLARQLLLERSGMPVADAIEHLVGLQAQTPHTWYHGLWSRLTDFVPQELSDMLADRSVVRIAVMRSTLHLVTARDALELRPLTQPAITRNLALNGADPAEVVKAGRELLDEKPLTASELGARLAERWPGSDPSLLAHAVREGAPLVQIPPRGLWGKTGRAVHATLETWLGTGLNTSPCLDTLVLRYLGAFGPASVRDAQIWSGLTRLSEVFARLRPQLMTFRGPDGVELFDLPDAPRPPEDTPVPVRYLYDLDNLLLSHHDRSRVMSPERLARQGTTGGMALRCFLVDGITRGEWTVNKTKNSAVLTINPYGKLTKKDTAALVAEGKHLLDFAAPQATTTDIQVRQL